MGKGRTVSIVSVFSIFMSLGFSVSMCERVSWSI